MTTDSQAGDSDRGHRRGVEWSDPDVPAGDSPQQPLWPLAVSAALWGGWVVFLAVIVLTY